MWTRLKGRVDGGYRGQAGGAHTNEVDFNKTRRQLKGLKCSVDVFVAQSQLGQGGGSGQATEVAGYVLRKSSTRATEVQHLQVDNVELISV